jgi:hypothetical protein
MVLRKRIEKKTEAEIEQEINEEIPNRRLEILKRWKDFSKGAHAFAYNHRRQFPTRIRFRP